MNGYDNTVALPLTATLNTNGGSNSGFGDNSGWWIILLLLALGGWNNGGAFGGNFGGNGGFGMYPWIANGQQEIMSNTNYGFDTLHLSNQIEGVRDGIYGLSNQLCNCCADMQQTVNAGFANAETSANARQMANMNQMYGISTQIAGASSDNRLGIADLKYTVATENCADRQALNEGIRDVIASNTANTQAILDKLCQQEIDAKNDTIAQLRTQLNMAALNASQTAQTAELRTSQATIANQAISELRSCPIPSQPVYGNTPIFTCNGGCGCTGNNVAF